MKYRELLESEIDLSKEEHIQLLRFVIIYILNKDNDNKIVKKEVVKIKNSIDRNIKDYKLDSNKVYNYFGNIKNSDISDEMDKASKLLDKKEKELKDNSIQKFKKRSNVNIEKNKKQAEDLYDKIKEHLKTKGNYVQITTMTKSFVFVDINDFRLSGTSISIRSGKNWGSFFSNGILLTGLKYGSY